MRMVLTNDIDTTHLLSDHDSEGRESSTTHSGDSEKLDESRDIVALADNIFLRLNLGVDVVEISSGFEWSIAQAKQGLIGLIVSSFLNIPTRALRTKVDSGPERDGGDECASELEMPRDIASVFDCEIGAEPEEMPNAVHIW
jgi:hypothetical protein